MNALTKIYEKHVKDGKPVDVGGAAKKRKRS